MIKLPNTHRNKTRGHALFRKLSPSKGKIVFTRGPFKGFEISTSKYTLVETYPPGTATPEGKIPTKLPVTPLDAPNTDWAHAQYR